MFMNGVLRNKGGELAYILIYFSIYEASSPKIINFLLENLLSRAET